MLELKSGVGAATTNARLTLTVTSGQTSEWVLVDDEIRSIACDLLPAGGASGYFETSNDVAGVLNNTAVGIPWSLGTVNAATNSYCINVYAIRLVSVSGVVKGCLNATY